MVSYNLDPLALACWAEMADKEIWQKIDFWN